MIFDGEVLYVHKNMSNTLYMKRTDDGVIFSTQPLDSGWEDYPVCTLRAYKNGELLFESDEKTTEFVPTLEYISSMAALHI